MYAIRSYYVSGFDGIQAVKHIADLSRGSIAELFFSRVPEDVFRLGEYLLLVDDEGRLLLLNCQS